jgi:hypothetical protein
MSNFFIKQSNFFSFIDHIDNYSQIADFDQIAFDEVLNVAKKSYENNLISKKQLNKIIGYGSMKLI